MSDHFSNFEPSAIFRMDYLELDFPENISSDHFSNFEPSKSSPMDYLGLECPENVSSDFLTLLTQENTFSEENDILGFHPSYLSTKKIESEIGDQIDLNLISPLVHQFKKYKPRANMTSHVVETQTNDFIKKGSFFLQPRAHANFGFFNNGLTIPKAQFRVEVQIEGVYKHVENCQIHRENLR